MEFCRGGRSCSASEGASFAVLEKRYHILRVQYKGTGISSRVALAVCRLICLTAGLASRDAFDNGSR